MKNDKKMLSTRDLIVTALETVKTTRRQTLLIVFLGMIGPQMVLSWIFDVRSRAAVALTRELASQSPSAPRGFMDLLGPAAAYAGPLASLGIVVFLMILVSYMALVHVVVAHHRQQSAASLGAVFWEGAKSTVPGGIVILASLFLLTVIGQILIAPAIIIGVLGLVIPVILVAERNSPFRAVWNALTMSYAKQSQHSGWSILFALLTFGAAFYTLVAAIAFFSQSALKLDEIFGLGREAWTWTFPGAPFGPIYLIVSTLETATSMGMVAMFPALTAALYFSVVGQRELARV